MPTSMPSSFPVFVFVHSSPIEKTDFCGSFPANPLPRSGWAPVGIIPGYDGIDDASRKMLERDLGGDIPVHVAVIPLTDKPGYMGALTGVGVFVDTYEQAKALPGFAPLWNDTGYQFLTPKNTPQSDDPISRHRFEGEALPRYRDGVFVQSCIPQGYIAATVHFEDDPLHYYFVQDRTAAIRSSDAMIAAVREWRSANGF